MFVSSKARSWRDPISCGTVQQPAFQCFVRIIFFVRIIYFLSFFVSIWITFSPQNYIFFFHLCFARIIFFFLNGFCKNYLFCANQLSLSEFSFFPLFLFALNFTLIFSVFFFVFLIFPLDIFLLSPVE